jgi:hypothetical protein
MADVMNLKRKTKDYITLENFKSYDYLQKHLAQTAYKWGRSNEKQQADLFRENEQNRAFYLSIDSTRVVSFLRHLDEICLKDALDLMNVDILSQALCDADNVGWLLSKFIPAKSLGEAVLAIIKTTDDARQAIFKITTDMNKLSLRIDKAQNTRSPKSGVKYVATTSLMSSLPQSARQCISCDQEYTEWQNIELFKCLKHSRHTDCEIVCPCFKPRSLLQDLSWDILEDPSTATHHDGTPVDFLENIFDEDTTLVVLDAAQNQERSIPVSGRTVQDVLQTIHDFYKKAEAKFAETHDEDNSDFEAERNEDLDTFGWDMTDSSYFSEIEWNVVCLQWVVRLE